MFWLSVVLLLTGCQAVGPRERRTIPGVVDDPRLTISDQERKGRDRLAFPDTSPTAGPRTYFESPWTRSDVSSP
jgi:hypothetical protein